MPLKTDNELMAQFRMCSVEAYMEIFLRYQRKLLNFSFGFTHDQDASEDVVQNTMLKVYDYKFRYEPSHEFSTWIYTIAKNLSINEFYRTRRFIEYEHTGNQYDLFDRDMSGEYIRKKISELPETYIDVIISRYIEGYSFQEIAETTGKNINTLKSQAKRGLELLKRMVEEDAV
jgi:RNA polymerase sigma-70 factor, ECF subfamily